MLGRDTLGFTRQRKTLGIWMGIGSNLFISVLILFKNKFLEDT